jgi:DNA repair ATPase RecN
MKTSSLPKTNWEQSLQDLERLLLTAQVQRNTIQTRQTALQQEIADLSHEGDILAQVESALLVLSAETTKKYVTTISQLVTDGLRAIFDDLHLEFQAEMVTYRGVSGIKFSLLQDGKAAPLLEGYGGGVLAVVSVLLRVVTILLLNIQRVLILDESLAHVSAQYIANTSKLLRKLTDDLGFTIVLVTHQTEFVEFANTHYEIVPGTQGMTFKKK